MCFAEVRAVVSGPGAFEFMAYRPAEELFLRERDPNSPSRAADVEPVPQGIH